MFSRPVCCVWSTLQLRLNCLVRRHRDTAWPHSWLTSHIEICIYDVITEWRTTFIIFGFSDNDKFIHWVKSNLFLWMGWWWRCGKNRPHLLTLPTRSAGGTEHDPQTLSPAMEDQAEETSCSSSASSRDSSADSESDESPGENLQSQTFFQVHTDWSGLRLFVTNALFLENVRDDGVFWDWL